MDLRKDYDFMKRITVIGAGGTGHALAAILAAKGHRVCLADTEAYSDILMQTQKLHEIQVSGTTEMVGCLAEVSTDIGRAVTDAELIICCTVSNRDEEIARLMVSYLNAEQAVLISAGNGASIIYHDIFEEAGRGDTLVGEVAGNFFPCRLTASGQVLIGLPLSPKGVAAFPPERSSELAQRFADVWELRPCRSLFEAIFNGPNLICHGAGIAANLAAIDRSNGTFNLFKDGLSPAYLNLTDALWEEKRRVYEAMGCIVPPAPREMLAGVMDTENEDYRFFREMDGPGSLEHRYITEDVPCLLCFFVSIARSLEVQIPLFEGIVRILSAAADRDFYAEGRTLEKLGLNGMGHRQLIDFFLAEK